MKADGVEAIEIETNFGGEKKTVEITGKTRKNIASILAGEAMKSIGKEPKPDTASSTDTQLQPQVIICPYCECQEIDRLSTEKITSQLALFEGDAVQTKTKVKHQDTFICKKCGALARLSWREAKKEDGKDNG